MSIINTIVIVAIAIVAIDLIASAILIIKQPWRVKTLQANLNRMFGRFNR